MLIIVEGNISAGKSTLCKNLAQLLNYKLFLEPAVEGNPYLQLFYQDPKKYALKMQLWLLRRRFETYAEAIRLISSNQCEGVLLDRSVFSDYVFAVKNFEDGNISSEGLLQISQHLWSSHRDQDFCWSKKLIFHTIHFFSFFCILKTYRLWILLAP